MRFSGKELDKESGLYYFGARYYAPHHYRWISPDPSLNTEAAIADPQLWNMYNFARSNPVRYYDPDGRWIDTVLDVASLAYDVKELIHNPKRGENWLALFADIGTMVLPGIAAGGAIVRGAVRGEKAYKRAGQLHHIISRKIMRALKRYTSLWKVIGRDRLIVRASDIFSHIGYQGWHRELDRRIVEWLKKYKEATPKEFLEKLIQEYNTPEMRRKFPGAVKKLKDLMKEFK